MAFVMVSLIVVLKWEQEKRGARIARNDITAISHQLRRNFDFVIGRSLIFYSHFKMTLESKWNFSDGRVVIYIYCEFVCRSC